MVSFAVYSTMNKPKSARLAEIDANIQACMREMQGLGVGTELGMFGQPLNTTAVPPAYDPIEKPPGGVKLLGLPPKKGKTVTAVPIISGSPEVVSVQDSEDGAFETAAESAFKEQRDVFNKIDRFPAEFDAKGKAVPWSRGGTYVVIHKYYVPVKYLVESQAESHEKILAMKAFKDWCENLDEEFSVTEMTIQSVDPGPGGILFVKFSLSIYDSAYKKIPAVVFMRGGSVAMLPVFTDADTKIKWTIMTRQARVPVGVAKFFEIPAGMIDSSSNFAGVAATELREELELVVQQRHLFDLTDFIHNDVKTGVYPSAGGCDEFMRIYLYEKTLPHVELVDMIAKMEAKITGNTHEGEKIRLKFVELDKLIFNAPDMKALSALAMYAEFDRQRAAYLEAKRGNDKSEENGLKLEFQRLHEERSMSAKEFISRSRAE